MTRDEYDVLLGLLESFLDDSVITEVLEVVKGGKEATVFRCAAAPSSGERFFAAKVYRPMHRRSFHNDAVYQQGRVILNARSRRAYEKGTEFGRKVQYGRWVGSEFATQQALYDAGADVPKPIACNGSAIIMEWIGDETSPAMQLRHIKLQARQTHEVFDTLLANIELMLRNNVIHGDLSPFNILYSDGRVKIIDFPQAVDARMNPNSYALLSRDVGNVCEYFAKCGVRCDAARIAGGLWSRFMRAEL
jgi:RIO kinase 1